MTLLPFSFLPSKLPCLSKVFLVFVLLLASGYQSCLAQVEEEIVQSKEAAIIGEIRSGSWKLPRVEQLIRRLVSGGNRHAARWWTAHACDAAVQGLLPKKTPKSLRIVGKLAGLKPVEPQLRALPTRALKHLKKIQSLKCYSAIPGAVHFAKRCLELYPDGKLRAKVEAIEASLEQVDWKIARPMGAALVKSRGRLAASLVQARDDLLDDMIQQYRSFPCPPGARAIRALILAQGEKNLSPKWKSAWQEVAEIEYRVEPKQTLKLWLENGGKVYVYRYGKRFLGTRGRSYFGDKKQGVEFQVLAGDVLQIEVKKVHAKRGKRKLFLVAVGAKLDGVELPQSAWTQNANHNAASLDPQSNAMCYGIEFSPDQMPKDIDDSIVELMVSLGSGILIPTANEFHHYAVGQHKKLLAAIAAFKNHGLGYTWICGESDRLAVILQIPRWGE